VSPAPSGFIASRISACSAVGVLVLVDEHVVEVRADVLREARLLHHAVPEQQQVVVIEQRQLLLALDVGAEQRASARPPIARTTGTATRAFPSAVWRVDAMRIDREAGVLAREALVLLAKPSCSRRLSIRSAESPRSRTVKFGSRFRCLRVVAQQPVADRMEGARPLHALQQATG
jgi:hypothetical protein